MGLATTDNNMDEKKMQKRGCQDILCKGDLFATTTTNDKEVDKYQLIISNVLSQLTARGDKVKNDNKQFRSSSGKLPPITLEAYIARLIQYAPCERECFLAALLYMDRLAERTGFVFNSMNIHRSYLVSLLLAAKFFEDQPCDNGYFATVGGVSLQELNIMEGLFLGLVEFRVCVTGMEYNVYAQLVEDNIQNINRPKIYTKEASIGRIPDTMVAASSW